MKQKIKKDLIIFFWELPLKTQIFAKINDDKSPVEYPKKEAKIKFLKIKYNELNTTKFIHVAINPEVTNLNI